MATGMERLGVIIGRTRHKMVMIELDEAVKRGVERVELRLDFLAKAIDFKRLMPLKKCEWIATFRRREDGGRWAGSEAERQMVLRQAIIAGFDYVDLETDIADRVPRFGKVKRIVSYHNLTETPPDLEEIHARLCAQDADIVKLAVTAQTPMDNLRVLKLIQNAPKPTIAHCMGDLGTISRVLSLKYGAPFMYAAFNPERAIAPGLLTFEEIRRGYPLKTLNPATRVFAVIGDPIGQSLSPYLHNQLYKLHGLDAIYLPIRVPREHLTATIAAFEALPVEGYSVTIPHKEAAAVLAAGADDIVHLTKAANTLCRRDGRFHALNTDYTAALESLRTAPPEDEEGKVVPLAGCDALILGAGGAARAVAHALKREGANLLVAGRTPARAELLAEEVGGKALDWEHRHSVDCHVVVNCTPLGMHPNVDESPLHRGYLKPGMTVFDTVYNPENTLLIKEARARGCKTVSGTEMFARQAALQFTAFTGIPQELEPLKQLLRQALSPVAQRAGGRGGVGSPAPAKPLREGSARGQAVRRRHEGHFCPLPRRPGAAAGYRGPPHRVPGQEPGRPTSTAIW